MSPQSLDVTCYSIALLSQCFVAVIDCCIILCYGSEGSGPFACLSFRLYYLWDFIDIFLTCCRYAYCRNFICTDIRLEMLSLLYSSDIFFSERTVVLACCRTSILMDIRLVLLSFLYCPPVFTADVRSFAQPLFGYFSSPVLVVPDELASPGKVL